MFAHVHQDWEAFKASPPGRRFQDVHKRREERGGRAAGLLHISLLVAGVLLTVAGLIFLFVPGPGAVTLAAGIALIARQSLLVARVADRLEVAVRPAFLHIRARWQKLGHAQRVAISAGVTALGCLVSAWLYFHVVR